MNSDPDSGTTTSQLRKKPIDKTRAEPEPAASPLGTDDEAAGTTPTEDRVRMAHEAEKKIEDAARRK